MYSSLLNILILTIFIKYYKFQYQIKKMTKQKQFCKTIECFHIPYKNNCNLCGCYINKDVHTYKSRRYLFTKQQNLQKYFLSLKNKSNNFIALKHNVQFSETNFYFLEKIANKFQFSTETLALALYFYLQFKNKIIQFHQSDFYPSICLIVAAKIIQVDKNIPYFSIYQKYACKNTSLAEYIKAEREIIQLFDYNLQIPTFVTFINYYLSNGIIFSDDYIDKKKTYQVEDRVIHCLNNQLKSGKFISENQQKLAAKIIYQTRRQFGLTWHPLLEEYSKMNVNMFQESHLNILKSIYPESMRGNKKIIDLSFVKVEKWKQNQEQISNKKQKFVVMKTKLKPLRSGTSSILNVISFRKIQLQT